MAEKADKTESEIPYSMLEYTAVFKKPIIEAAAVPAVLIAAVLKALEPSGFKLDGVELRTQTARLHEYEIEFRRSTPVTPSRSLVLGLTKVVVKAENLDWTEAEQLLAEMGAALNVIRQTARAEIQSQRLLLGMHVQLKGKPREDVTAPLLSPVAFKLLDGQVRFPGVILLGEKATIIIDASLAYANGLFVRVSREHPAETTLAELAEVLHKDEEQLFDVLGLEGTL